MLNILIAVWVVISISLDLHTKRLTIVHQLKQDTNKVVTKKKKRTEISFTIDDNETIYPEFIPHQIVLGNDRGHSPRCNCA